MKIQTSLVTGVGSGFVLCRKETIIDFAYMHIGTGY